LIILLALIASMCTGTNDNGVPIRSIMKIGLFDSLAVDYEDDARRLPENLRELCDVLVSDTRDCKHTFILEPTLYRIDLEKNLSLKTTIEKGGAKNIYNPKVIGKLIQKHFEELEIPKIFTERSSSSKTSLEQLNSFLKINSLLDSIIIFNENSSLEYYILNGKKYRIFTTIADVRNYITSILCQSPKTNFSFLINPPTLNEQQKVPLTLDIKEVNCETGKITLVTTGGDGSSIRFSADGLQKGSHDNEFIIPKSQRKGQVFNFLAIQGEITRKINYTTSCPQLVKPTIGRQGKVVSTLTGINGDLTIMKGSEGCDLCTRYYSATDNLGRIHEVKEKNSITCCPCGKTIEMKGKTYRMECGESGNRLALVE